jgi:26S proteasome regulatory subunit N6
MSGTLHCEEADYDTAYSYFLEAYEAYDSLEDKVSATRCLKYMLLCRILVVDPRGAVGANGDGAGVLQKRATASVFPRDA